IDYGPGGRSHGVVIEAPLGLAGLGVALARRRGEEQVELRERRPVGLAKVLAGVLDLGVVGGVGFAGEGPVVRGPDHFGARHGRAQGEAAPAGEEVDGLHRSTSLSSLRELRRSIRTSAMSASSSSMARSRSAGPIAVNAAL